MDTSKLADADLASIAQLREQWLAAIHRDSLDGLMNPVAEDCATFPPNEAALHGLDPQRRWHQARIAQFTTRLTITPDELSGAGDWALDRWSYTITLTPRAGGAALQDSGCCFWILRRDGSGTWKVARAIWNSANPIAAA